MLKLYGIWLEAGATGGYYLNVMDTGAQVHARFKGCSTRGVWSLMLEYAQQNADKEVVMIDSTIVRSHACSAGYAKNTQDEQALGRSKGGFCTKIHGYSRRIRISFEILSHAG